MISLVEFVAICSVATLTAAGASQGWDRLRRPRVNRSTDRKNPRRWIRTTIRWGMARTSLWQATRSPVRDRVPGGSAEARGHTDRCVAPGLAGNGSFAGSRWHQLSVRVFFPDTAQSVFIEEAVVRWSDGLDFGVELTRISPEDAQVLSEYLSVHYPMEPSPSHAFSPFSYN